MCLAGAAQECKASKEVLVPACSVLVQAYPSLRRLVQAIEDACYSQLCSGPNIPSSTAHLGEHAIPLLPCHWQHLSWADQPPQVGHTVLDVAAPAQWCARWESGKAHRTGMNVSQSCCHATVGCWPPAAAPLTASALRPGGLAMRGRASVKGVGTGAVTGEDNCTGWLRLTCETASQVGAPHW